MASLFAALFFILAFCLRIHPDPEIHGWGRVLYCVSAGFWYLRIYIFLGVHPVLGPVINIFGKMVRTRSVLKDVENVLGILVQKNSDYSPSNTAKNIYLDVRTSK